jgi:hypothetical protein
VWNQTLPQNPGMRKVGNFLATSWDSWEISDTIKKCYEMKLKYLQKSIKYWIFMLLKLTFKRPNPNTPYFKILISSIFVGILFGRNFIPFERMLTTLILSCDDDSTAGMRVWKYIVSDVALQLNYYVDCSILLNVFFHINVLFDIPKILHSYSVTAMVCKVYWIWNISFSIFFFLCNATSL